MKKIALVLSGGGAKGAFQVGAETYARERRGYAWSVISGVSIGAANGAFMAMGRHDRLKEIWFGITPDAIFGRDRRAWHVGRRLLSGGPSVFGNQGIKAFVQEIEPAAMRVELIIGAVSLVTGAFHAFRPDHPHFMDALLASGSLPLVFPPVDVGALTSMIDGGTRNVSPLGLVRDSGPDEIVVINCSSAASLPIAEAPTTALKISQRASEIAMFEIFSNDIGNFLRTNRLVEQAAASGVTLTSASGRPLRSYRITVIEPTERLGETTDFTQAHVRRAYDAGWETAKKILG